jgi:hypothetical protein
MSFFCIPYMIVVLCSINVVAIVPCVQLAFHSTATIARGEQIQRNTLRTRPWVAYRPLTSPASLKTIPRHLDDVKRCWSCRYAAPTKTMLLVHNKLSWPWPQYTLLSTPSNNAMIQSSRGEQQVKSNQGVLYRIQAVLG